MPDIPKIKRMAILHGRDGDSREFFQNHWLTVHGAVVAGLPHLRSYIQNHVQEDFLAGGTTPAFRVDGIVEQLWNSAAEMQRGYRADSEQVKAMLADEPNYIGHGSNYAMLASGPLKSAADGSKLIVIIRHRGQTEAADNLARKAETLPGLTDINRDDVIATIQKMGMAAPDPVDAFLHIYFRDAVTAHDAGGKLSATSAGLLPNIAVGICRVRTETII